MKMLENGFFYNVYDIGDNLVLKKKRSFLDILTNTKLKNISLVLKQHKVAKSQTLLIKKKLSVLPASLLGNPRFINSYNYKQDKVELLYEYFENHSIEENKAIIKKYLELVVELLKYGIHDYTYKFKNSYGVTSQNEVVFIDFNEITASKDEVLKLVDSRHWLIEAQYTKFPEGELKYFIRDTFDSELSTTVVEELWAKNII